MCFLGVGGALDIWSNALRRAPKWIQRLGPGMAVSNDLGTKTICSITGTDTFSKSSDER